MDNFNYKEYLKNNPLLNEEMEDEGSFEASDETKTTISNWAAADQAQLDDYEKNGPKEITIGDNNFKVESYFMNDKDVPTIAIVNSNTNSVHTIPLAVVWSGYQNYSALNEPRRKELMGKYDLN